MPNGRRYPVPPKDDASKTSTFLDHVLSPDNTYRLERFSIWERVRLMKQNNQWLEPDMSDDPTQTPFWKVTEVDETNWSPMPVQNEMIEPLQNETARLQGNGSRPYIKPTEDTPDKQRAAKLSRDVLLDRLDVLRWREHEHEGVTSCVDFGTWVFRTGWDIDYSKTIKTPVLTAKKCPECDFTVADPSVPPKRVMGMVDDPMMQGRLNVQSMKDENNPLNPATYRAKVTHCLTCQAPPTPPAAPAIPGEMMPAELAAPSSAWAPPELEEYMPKPEQAKNGFDHFKRPLGEDTPIGEVYVENVSVFDYYPENQGLEVKFNQVMENGQATIRSLDWIVNHYPENGAKVQAEDAATLMKWHPVAGSSRHAMGGGEKDLFQNHALVREWHKDPWVVIDEHTKIPKLNRGRSLVMAGPIVLLDDDFMIECKDKTGQPTGDLIPRIQYQVVPWEVREKELFGLGAGELIMPQQVTINTMLAQVQDARHRFGSPKLLAEEGTDLIYAGFADTGYQSDVYYYRPGSEGAKPEPFGNIQMDQEWTNEYNIYVDSIHRAVGTMDAETGGTPGGGKAEWSAQALMYLGEKASERRKNRIDRIREAKRRAYKHMLQLIQEKYREDRDYRVKRVSTSERISIKKFKGLDLQGQHDVVFDDEPAYDTRLVRQAAMKEGLQAGTIIPDTASARRKINRELGAPLDINEEQNKQVERSIDEFCLFFDEGRDPAVSQRGDDHTIHFQQHMLDLMGDEAEQLMSDVDWSQIELALWGWEEDFDALMAMEQQIKLNPPGDKPLAPMPGLDGKVAPGAAEEALAQWQHAKQIQATLAAMPKALELRIFEFQKQYLEKTGIFNQQQATPGLAPGLTVPGMPAPPAVVDLPRQNAAHRILRFKAHAEAHYRLSQAEAAKAAGGAMAPAAPGGIETASGTKPGAPGEAIPGSGAGPGAATASGGGGA